MAQTRKAIILDYKKYNEDPVYLKVLDNYQAPKFLLRMVDINNAEALIKAKGYDYCMYDDGSNIKKMVVVKSDKDALVMMYKQDVTVKNICGEELDKQDPDWKEKQQLGNIDNLDYKELQVIAKAIAVPANLPKDELIAKIKEAKGL